MRHAVGICNTRVNEGEEENEGVLPFIRDSSITFHTIFNDFFPMGDRTFEVGTAPFDVNNRFVIRDPQIACMKIFSGFLQISLK